MTSATTLAGATRGRSTGLDGVASCKTLWPKKGCFSVGEIDSTVVASVEAEVEVDELLEEMVDVVEITLVWMMESWLLRLILTYSLVFSEVVTSRLTSLSTELCRIGTAA